MQKPITPASDNEITGRYFQIGDMVIAVMEINISQVIQPYTKSISLPVPKMDKIMLDTEGKYRFQLNTNGVWQNESTLPAGKYRVNLIYIKK